MSAATVSVHVVRAILFAAAERGLDPPAMLARFGFTLEVIADDEARVPAGKVLALWTDLPALTGDDSFGLRLGERAPIPAHPVLGFAVRNSHTFGDALRCFFRFQRLAQNVTRGDVALAGGVGSLTVSAAPEIGVLPRHSLEFGFASAMALGRTLTGHDIRARAVRFQHAAPADVTEHARIFRAPVHFSQSKNVLEFDADVFALPLPAADPTLRDVLEGYARHLAAQLPETADFAPRVRHALHEALHGGDPSLESIARRLKMSTRTLQRRLRAEGTSHQELLDAERARLAQHYLADSELTIQEVTFMLGFSEQATFHRAFVRWTQRAPGAFRAERRGVRHSRPTGA